MITYEETFQKVCIYRAPIFICLSLLLLLNLYYYFMIQGESDEKSKTSPWTCIAKYKLLVEEELAKLEG